MSTARLVASRLLVTMFVLLAIASRPSAVVAAEVVFVDSANAGAPGQDGRSWATVWGTITQGVNDPRWYGNPGRVVLVRSGVYREQIDIGGARSGTPGALSIIRAETPGVMVDGERVRNECFLIDGQAAYIPARTSADREVVRPMYAVAWPAGPRPRCVAEAWT